MPPDRQRLGRPGPGPALGASGPSRVRVTVELEEHGGYFCAGCKKTWSSLRSLNHHRASPYMRGTECEEVKNSRELRNIFRANLATGQDSRLPLFSEGEGKAQRETTGIHQSELTSPTCLPMSLSRLPCPHYYILHSSRKYFVILRLLLNTTYYIPPKNVVGGLSPQLHFCRKECNMQYLEVFKTKYSNYYNYCQLLPITT